MRPRQAGRERQQDGLQWAGLRTAVPTVLHALQLPRGGVLAPRKDAITVLQAGVTALRDGVTVLLAEVMVLRVAAVTADLLGRPLI